MKKLITLLCSLMMIVALGVSASADSSTITITNTESGHTYSAYQIFSGDLREEPLMRKIAGHDYPVYECEGKDGLNQTVKVGDSYYLVSKLTEPDGELVESALKVELDKISGAEHVHDNTKSIKPVMIQHMYELEWGNALTEDAKALIVIYYYSNNFQADLLTAYNGYTAYKEENAGASFYGYLVSRYMENNTGVTYDDADAHIIDNTSQRIREAGDARELANLIADPYKLTVGTTEVTLETLVEKNATSVSSSQGETTITLPADGYYMIKDSVNDGLKGVAISQYMVEVAGQAMVQNKGDAPVVIKKVFDNTAAQTNDVKKDSVLDSVELGVNSAYTDTKGFWNDNADYNIGDEVPFRLYFTLPTTYVNYNSYKAVLTDTLDPALTVNENSFNVFVKTGDTYYDVVKDGAIVNGVNGVSKENTTTNGFTITFANLKNLFSADNVSKVNSSSVIIVEYTATLNGSAMPVVDKTNEGHKNTVKLTYSSNPNVGHEGETKETPEDSVKVFTYAISLEKIDAQKTDTHLAGAKFKLQRKSDGKFYALTDNGVSWVDTKDAASEIVSTGNKFEIKGLDDGDYNLYETVAPFGYSLPIDPFQFTIGSALPHTQAGPAANLSNVSVTVNTDANGDKMVATAASTGDGFVHATIKNTSQSELPTTGGIGTTMIYAAGAVMVIGAGILLVVKRRSEAK